LRMLLRSPREGALYPVAASSTFSPKGSLLGAGRGGRRPAATTAPLSWASATRVRGHRIDWLRRGDLRGIHHLRARLLVLHDDELHADLFTDTSVRVGGVFPLSHDEFFDTEFMFSVIRRF